MSGEIIHIPRKEPILFDDFIICQHERYVNYRGRTMTREEYDKLRELDEIKVPLRIYGRELDLHIKDRMIKSWMKKWGLFILILSAIIIFLSTQLFGRETDYDSFLDNYRKYEDIIDSAAKTFDLEPALIMAIITWESQWEVKAVSPNGRCKGLMQVKDGSFDPARNIMEGAGLLRSYINRIRRYCDWAGKLYTTGYLVRYGLSAYNMGIHAFMEKRLKKGLGATYYAIQVYAVYINIDLYLKKGIGL